jgi:hypothetical protein
MELKLEREYMTEAGATLGRLWIGDQFECYTLEDKVRILGPNCEGKVDGETAIPSGRYEIVMSFSDRFKRKLPLLLGVRCFSGIRIHAGNAAVDTKGCIMVGHEAVDGRVLRSKAALDNLLSKIERSTKTEKVWLTVT